jgi:uncharacterized cupin superfamily protein
MESRIRKLSDVPVATGLPASWSDAVKAELFSGKHEARLARAVDITQFGVNHVTLEPGSISALRHWHEAEDEFVYVLSGTLILIDENGEHALEQGNFAGFPAGYANAHHLVNRSNAAASFIVVGSRKPGEETIHYPDDAIGPIRK